MEGEEEVTGSVKITRKQNRTPVRGSGTHADELNAHAERKSEQTIEEEKKRRKEKEVRRRLRELERKYTIFLTCLQAPGYA